MVKIGYLHLGRKERLTSVLGRVMRQIVGAPARAAFLWPVWTVSLSEPQFAEKCKESPFAEKCKAIRDKRERFLVNKVAG